MHGHVCAMEPVTNPLLLVGRNEGKEGYLLFNDALNTFYLLLYDVSSRKDYSMK